MVYISYIILFARSPSLYVKDTFFRETHENSCISFIYSNNLQFSFFAFATQNEVVLIDNNNTLTALSRNTDIPNVCSHELSSLHAS